MSMMVSFVLSFFPRDVLDEILNLIESVSEDFPSYSYPQAGSTKIIIINKKIIHVIIILMKTLDNTTKEVDYTTLEKWKLGSSYSLKYDVSYF